MQPEQLKYTAGGQEKAKPRFARVRRLALAHLSAAH
jgi:hypothetical protein